MNAILVFTGVSESKILEAIRIENGYSVEADFNPEYGIMQKACLDDLNIVNGTSRIMADRRRQCTAVLSLIERKSNRISV